MHGSWSGAAAGPLLSVGKQTYVGEPLRPAVSIPANAALRRISWRISLLSPSPTGLKIKLCSMTACILLDRLTGQKATPLPFSPGDELRFIYVVNTNGQLKPPVRVVSHQVTINYQAGR
ncbi:flagellar protein FlhE [Pantoea alhagi]|uniref:flagellar protein FlhE n=1 Tax=Pantoea alhagi TaxID=1891675 RepID=UPI00202B74AE|nr:flagellar protein FlhE [Pantoea alhagi]URQ60866.1 flagellar protein FlhE [Pantoea alhagi]